MTNYIEPCCYNKQLGETIERSERTGKPEHFFTYSDWDGVQLLNTLAAYAEGGVLCIAMIHSDDELTEAVRKLLARSRVNPDNKAEVLPYIEKIILLTQPGTDGTALSRRIDIREKMGRYIESGRLTVAEDNIGFRCMLAVNDRHNIVVQGSINRQKSHAMQMLTLTADKPSCEGVHEMFVSKSRVKNVFRK